jgi:hypothetical protein
MISVAGFGPLIYPLSQMPFPLTQINCDSNAKLVVQLVELSTWSRIDSQGSINFEEIASSFRDEGIAFVNLWEDTWFANRKIVESRIKAMLGYSNRIPGRVTKVRRITKNEAVAFLHENHLQDPLAAKYRFGLFLPKNYFRLVPFLQTEEKFSKKMIPNTGLMNWCDSRTYSKR